MIKLVLIFCISLLCFSSCQNPAQEHITQLVKEWQGKEVHFLENPVFTRQLGDTVDSRIPEAEYKVLVYVDSIGCTSCKLQLPKWKELIAYVDSVSGGQVPFLFFFQSKDNKELRYILKRDNFRLPVCVDSQNEFGKLNRFPSELMFQTFLLDKDNRVKVIGNPIHNLSVKELYLKEIAGIKETEALALTQLVPDQEEYDMGIVAENETKKQKVLLKNTGNVPFVIKGITTSCDCTTAEYDWKEIAPDEQKEMVVSYKGEELGDFWRTVTVYGNIPDQSLTLSFVGRVE